MFGYELQSVISKKYNNNPKHTKRMIFIYDLVLYCNSLGSKCYIYSPQRIVKLNLSNRIRPKRSFTNELPTFNHAELEMLERIGHGSYGNVTTAIYRGRKVVLKC